MVDEDGHRLLNDDLFTQVQTFMVAGHETTSTAMTWTTLLLAKYPEIQQKVQEEIKGIIGKDEEITYEKLVRMKYLDNCIKESMRLYAPFIQLSRIALKDAQFGPYTIPEGTNVFVDICVAHTDGEFWKYAEKFNPERFDHISEQCFSDSYQSFRSCFSNLILFSAAFFFRNVCFSKPSF